MAAVVVAYAAFAWQGAEDRALGSLLHMIQDSYATSHTQRAAEDEGPGAILRFEFRGRQSVDCHAQGDSRKYCDASVEAGAHVLNAWQQRAYWSELEAYLTSGPFALDARDDLPPVCLKPE